MKSCLTARSLAPMIVGVPFEAVFHVSLGLFASSRLRVKDCLFEIGGFPVRGLRGDRTVPISLGESRFRLPDVGKEAILHPGHIGVVAFQFFAKHALLQDGPDGEETDKNRCAEHSVPGPQQ